MQDYTFNAGARELRSVGPKLQSLNQISEEPHIEGREGTIEDQIYRAGFLATPEPTGTGPRLRVFLCRPDVKTEAFRRGPSYRYLVRAAFAEMKTVFLKEGEFEPFLAWASPILRALDPMFWGRYATEAEQLRFSPPPYSSTIPISPVLPMVMAQDQDLPPLPAGAKLAHSPEAVTAANEIDAALAT